MKSGFIAVAAAAIVVAASTALHAHGLGAGAMQGTVKDPTGGVMQAVEVRLTNPVAGFTRTTTTDATGHFLFSNLPPNVYHISVDVQGFQQLERDVDVRAGAPVTLDLVLALAAASSSVDVVGHAEDLVEREAAAHTDIDASLVAKLPIEASSAGLNQVITLVSPGVAADSNGFFHPIGDHAQTQFAIDNQPITDQQSRLYSNQISQNAVQSLEIITGVPPAEYGDKNSLVVNVVTKSGLDGAKPSGSADAGYGSFNSPTADVTIGQGSRKAGDFLSMSALRTDRFLDPPELQSLHDSGDSANVFNRLDVRRNDADTLRLNLFAARSGFDVPNTFDELSRDQHQDIDTFNVAPAFTHVIGPNALMTANGFVRRDHLTYAPSASRFDDTPASVSQDRTLTNTGAKADVAVTAGNHTLKFGGTVAATRLHEQFTFAITNPADAAFFDDQGDFNAALAPFDLTEGGAPFSYDESFTVKEQAAYAEDAIKTRDVTLNAGVRLDHYDGLSSGTLLQPRLGASFAVPHTGTVLRAGYGRTMETPYNENLLLSAGYRLDGMFGPSQPVRPGTRDQVEVGFQQALGRWVMVDADYFDKHTQNAYDFAVLFDTPIAFPVAWDHSRINGFTGRVNLVEHGGFSAFVVLAHTNAIYSPPSAGGILTEAPEHEFRIDHDQKFNSTTNLQYVFSKRTGAWAGLSWRYDSGLVAGAVANLEDALALTADQQAAIGLFCGSKTATLDAAVTAADCTPSNVGALRVRIPAEGTEDDLTNPPRIAPRNVFDVGLGADNLLHTSAARMHVRFTVLNLTNTDALYNFLSTFSGTHFVAPRTYQLQVGVRF